MKRKVLNKKVIIPLILCVMISFFILYKNKGNHNIHQLLNSLYLEEYKTFKQPFINQEKLTIQMNGETIKLEAKNKLLEIEIKELQKLLDLETLIHDYTYKNTFVIARDIGNWNHEVMINIGENEDVKENMAVISNDGLIGFVREVHQRTSCVELLTNHKINAFPVMIFNEENTIYGLFDGYDVNLKMYRMLLLETIPDIKIGSSVVTSCYSKMTPIGIPIGEVEEVVSSGTSTYVYIKPYVKYNDINYLSVVFEE